eukprot:c20702_g1_i1 orf=208-1830(-)
MLISELCIRAASPVPGDHLMHPPPLAGSYTNFPSVGASEQVPGSFHPSVAVIIGVLTTMFAAIIFLLLYAKYCKRNMVRMTPSEDVVPPPPLLSDQDNGVDASIIENLPLFSFTSLQGTKDGLECAVCLCRYEDTDILRLLPKCKHAFHIDCVGKWLHNRSTCPLCRHRVEADDILLADEFLPGTKWVVDESHGLRRNSVYAPRSSTELEIERAFQFYVQRENELGGPSSIGFGLGSDCNRNFGSGGSVTSSLGSVKTDSSAREGMDDFRPANSAVDEERFARRLRHRIILSDFAFQHRWSDFLPSDVFFLNLHTILGSRERLSSSERNPEKNEIRVRTSKIESPRLSAASQSNSPGFSLPKFGETARLPASRNNSPRVSLSNLVEAPRLSYTSKPNDLPRLSFSKLESTNGNNAGTLKQKSSTQWETFKEDLETGLSPATCSKSIKTGNILNKSSKNKPEGRMPLALQQRSYSQFSGLERFAEPGRNLLACNFAESNPDRDARTRKWYIITKKTVNWLLGRERREGFCNSTQLFWRGSI